ncbi:MAG: SDR family NAD(P)-dependent oxidoreductase, partial [Actinomycetota bacterium]
MATTAASRGAKVGLIARGRDDLDTVLQTIGNDNGAAVAADVADPAQLATAIGKLEAELGPTDVLVANAGIGAYGPFAEVDPAEIERL